MWHRWQYNDPYFHTRHQQLQTLRHGQRKQVDFLFFTAQYHLLSTWPTTTVPWSIVFFPVCLDHCQCILVTVFFPVYLVYHHNSLVTVFSLVCLVHHHILYVTIFFIQLWQISIKQTETQRRKWREETEAVPVTKAFFLNWVLEALFVVTGGPVFGKQQSFFLHNFVFNLYSCHSLSHFFWLPVPELSLFKMLTSLQYKIVSQVLHNWTCCSQCVHGAKQQQGDDADG